MNVCVDVCVGVYVDVCVGVCVDVCEDVCVWMYVWMCVWGTLISSYHRTTSMCCVVLEVTWLSYMLHVLYVYIHI